MTTIAIITPEPQRELGTFGKALVEAGATALAWHPDEFTISGDGSLTYQNQPLPHVTRILWRTSESRYPEYQHLHQALSRHALCINTPAGMQACYDKRVTDRLLNEAGIPTLPSIIEPGVYAWGDLNQIWEESGVHPRHFRFDMAVTKPVIGAGGRGILVHERQGDGSIQVHDGECLQPFMNTHPGKLLRVQILHQQILGTYARVPAPGSQLANLEQGATSHLAHTNEVGLSTVLQAYEALPLVSAGVDLYQTEDNTAAYIIEVNSAPGMDGLAQAGIDAWGLYAETLVRHITLN